MVSVIVPVYNAEKYLVKCVESLINQTYKAIEIILVDDGSKDASYEICRQYSEKYNNISAFHIENHGVSYARNFGIEKSTGDYILFVDSDDYIENNMIEILLFEQKKKNADIVLCGYFREDGKGDSSILPTEIDGSFFGFEKLISYWVFNPLIGAPWNKLFESKKIKENNLRFREGMTYGEDFCFCMNYYSLINRYCTVPKALYHYRSTPNSLTKVNLVDADKLWRLQCLTCASLFEFVKNKGYSIADSECAKRAYSYICTHNFYVRIRTCGVIKSIRWLVSASNIKHKQLIRNTGKMYNLGKLNYVFKFLKMFAFFTRKSNCGVDELL